MRIERELALFMDNHLYNDGRFLTHRRTDDLTSQLSGSDIVLSLPAFKFERYHRR